MARLLRSNHTFLLVKQISNKIKGRHILLELVKNYRDLKLQSQASKYAEFVSLYTQRHLAIES